MNAEVLELVEVNTELHELLEVNAEILEFLEAKAQIVEYQLNAFVHVCIFDHGLSSNQSAATPLAVMF